MPIALRWIIALGYLAALPFMRGGWNAARARGAAFADALPLAAGLSLIAALAWYLLRAKRERRPSVYLFLAALLAAAAALFRSLGEPIMRIHIAQYALLGILVFWAMGGERGGPFVCIPALIATAFLGLADETLQGFMTGRFYDLRDVLLNLEAALLGQAVVASVLRPWEGREPLPRGAVRPHRRSRGLLAGTAAVVIAAALSAMNVALLEKGTPTWGPARVRQREGMRYFGFPAVAPNAAGAVSVALLAGPRRRGRGGREAGPLRAAALCGLLSPSMLVLGRLAGLHFH